MALGNEPAKVPSNIQAKKRLIATVAKLEICSTHSKQKTLHFSNRNKNSLFEFTLLFLFALPSALHAQSATANNAAVEINNRGLALYQSGKVDEAILLYRKALALNPDDAITLNNKGVVLFQLKRTDEARYKSIIEKLGIRR